MLWKLAQFSAEHLSYLSDHGILEIRGNEIRPLMHPPPVLERYSPTIE